LVRRSEASFLAIAFRARLDERDLAVLAVQIDAPVGEDHRRGADRALLPFDVARREVDRDHRAAGRSVERVAELDRSADRGGILRAEIELAGLDLISLSLELHRAATRSRGSDV